MPAGSLVTCGVGETAAADGSRAVDTPAEATQLRTIQDVVNEIDRLVAEKQAPKKVAV